MYIKDPRDVRLLEEKYGDISSLTADYINKRVKRLIPESSVLYNNLKSVFDKFKNIKHNVTQLPLLNEDARSDFEALLIHAKSGCVSDMPGINLYYECKKIDGVQTYRCVRGSNKDETVHKNFLMFSPWKAGVMLGEYILFDQIFR
jgi:hypothetical protein